jgi:hypothetical protein
MRREGIREILEGRFSILILDRIQNSEYRIQKKEYQALEELNVLLRYSTPIKRFCLGPTKRICL